MTQTLLVLNAALTFVFGAVAVCIPALIFAPFGIALDAGGEAIARGYAATLIGYGLALYLLREVRDGAIARALLVSLIAFNGIETGIQAFAVWQGAASGMIYLTIATHAGLAIACAIGFRQHA